jgi:hypothetical protein
MGPASRARFGILHRSQSSIQLKAEPSCSGHHWDGRVRPVAEVCLPHRACLVGEVIKHFRRAKTGTFEITSSALKTRNLHFAVRPVPKVRYSEAFQEGICLYYFFSLGPTRCVGHCHNESGVGILHCR